MASGSTSRTFLDWFVASCPPSDAGDAECEVYRFVKKNPIDPAEFRSYHETGQRPTANSCQRCGLSVFLNVEDVRAFLRHLWQNYPDRGYGPHIFKRSLTANDGKIQPTGNHGHHTWWAFEGIERHASFVFVETVPST